MRRSLALLCASLLLLPVAGALPAGILSRECGGRAPSTTSCSTGEHTGIILFVGSSFGPPDDLYFGTIENRLVHEGGTQTFRCHAGGDPAAGTYKTWCDERPEGPAPGLGARVRHECSSFALGTRVAGGSGPWGCAVRFVL